MDNIDNFVKRYPEYNLWYTNQDNLSLEINEYLLKFSRY